MMNRTVKKIGVEIVIVLAVLIAVALIAPFLIPESVYKNQIHDQIQKITGREVTINGTLRLKFFPYVGAYAQDITLSNPKDFPDTTPFLTLKSMEVSVAVIPLLRGQITVKSLTLQDPEVNLHIAANGNVNWLFTNAGNTAPVAPAEPAGVPQPSNASAPLSLPGNLLLSHFKLSNGTVHFANDTTHIHWSADKLDGSVELNGLDWPFTVKGAGEWNNKTVAVSGSLQTLNTLLTRQPTLINMAIESDPAKMSLNGTFYHDHYIGKLLLSSPSLKDAIAWASPDAKPLSYTAPLVTDIDGKIDCMPSKLFCSLADTHISIDDFTAKGSVKAYMDNERNIPHIEADLSMGTIDLNLLLPLAKHASLPDNPLVPDAFAETTERWSSTPLDLSAMDKVSLLFNIKNEGIIYQNLHVGAGTFRLKLDQRRLGADLVGVDLYKGKADISASLDGSLATPAIETHSFFKDVQVGPLLKDATGNARVDGKVNIEANINGYGKSISDIMASLTGSGNAAMQDGVVHGVNLGDMLHNVQAAFGAGGGDSSAETKITSAKGTFTIARGILSNNDLTMILTGMQATGKGAVDLPAYTMHYILTPQLVNSAAAADSQAGLSVPVVIDGSLDNLSYHPDVKGALQNALQNPSALKSQLKNSKGAMQGLKGLLQGL